MRRIVIETAIVLTADRNRAKSSSKPQLSSPPIEIAPNRRRKCNCPRCRSMLRQIVVESAIVLAADQNLAKAAKDTERTAAGRGRGSRNRATDAGRACQQDAEKGLSSRGQSCWRRGRRMGVPQATIGIYSLVMLWHLPKTSSGAPAGGADRRGSHCWGMHPNFPHDSPVRLV